jgi:hypothetical protein
VRFFVAGISGALVGPFVGDLAGGLVGAFDGGLVGDVVGNTHTFVALGVPLASIGPP